MKKSAYPLLIASIVFLLTGLPAGTSQADAPATPMGDAKKPALKKRKPVTCTNTDDIVLDKVLIESSGPAATVMGSCDITIKNSVIRTTGSAIVIRGSGDVTIIDSTVESKTVAVHVEGSGDFDVRDSRITGEVSVQIDGSGDVSAKSTRFRGKKVVRGTGEYKDEGGNTWE